MFAVLERLCSFFTKGANIDEASQFENRIIPRSAIKSGYKPQIKYFMYNRGKLLSAF